MARPKDICIFCGLQQCLRFGISIDAIHSFVFAGLDNGTVSSMSAGKPAIVVNDHKKKTETTAADVLNVEAWNALATTTSPLKRRKDENGSVNDTNTLFTSAYDEKLIDALTKVASSPTPSVVNTLPYELLSQVGIVCECGRRFEYMVPDRVTTQCFWSEHFHDLTGLSEEKEQSPHAIVTRGRTRRFCSRDFKRIAGCCFVCGISIFKPVDGNTLKPQSVDLKSVFPKVLPAALAKEGPVYICADCTALNVDLPTLSYYDDPFLAAINRAAGAFNAKLKALFPATEHKTIMPQLAPILASIKRLSEKELLGFTAHVNAISSAVSPADFVNKIKGAHALRLLSPISV